MQSNNLTGRRADSLRDRFSDGTPPAACRLPEEAGDSQAALEKERCLLLVVEDSPSDVYFLKRAAATIGFPCDIVVATDGQRAIEYLEQLDAAGPSCPTHLLLDLKLPRRTGIELLEWIRTRSSFRRLPVIVLTSSNLEADRTRARELGIDAYFVKPVEFPELLKVVRNIAKVWGFSVN